MFHDPEENYSQMSIVEVGIEAKRIRVNICESKDYLML